MDNNRFITGDTGSVFYRMYGEGKPVVLLHGFGEDGNIWTETINELKSFCRLIVPDIPGSGKSTILKKQVNEITIDDYTGVVIKILQKEDISKCTIIGHSMGGYITLSIAEKHPGVLDSFGLFHSSAYADDEDKKTNRRKSIEFLKENEGITFLKTTVPGLFAVDFQQQHPEVIENLLESVSDFSSEALIQYSTAMLNRPDRTMVLKQSSVPVLFIIGEKDNAVPLSQSLAQCHIPGVSSIHILPESAHMGLLETPQKCAGFITSFLSTTSLLYD